jgi:sulfur-carrier protein adenylyltransferase/sulfurtransferase
MNFRFILSLALLFLGFVAAILPQRSNPSAELDARQLLAEMRLETYVVTVDELADALINADPSWQLIDLRSPADFAEFHLPGALNIPFDSLLTEAWQPYLDQSARRNVFYGNGTSLARQAWYLTRQMGYQHNYILEGGLNNWFDTILFPKEPAETEGAEALARYQRRLGAKQFFTGAGAQAADPGEAAARKPVPARKKKMVSGGCS